MTPPPPVPRTPADVLAVVVAALGSWPAESLVLVGLGPGRRPAAVVRARLELLLEEEPDEVELALRVDAVVDPCAATGARGAVVLLLAEVPGRDERVIAATVAALERAGLALADAAVLRGGRWACARGPGASSAVGRLPPAGAGAAAAAREPDRAPGVTDPPSGPAAGCAPADCAAAIAALDAAGTTSADLDAHLLPAWFDVLDRVVDHTAGAVRPAATAPTATAPRAAAVDGPPRTSAHDTAAHDTAARDALDAPLAAWLLVGLAEPARRDALLASVLPGGRAALTADHPAAARDRWGRAVTGVLDAGTAGAPVELDAAAALLRRLVHLAPEAARAEPLAVLAWWAWWRGRPEQAATTAGRALAAHPGHGLAGLVLSCVEHRLVPAWARAAAPLDPARAVIYPRRRS